MVGHDEEEEEENEVPNAPTPPSPTPAPSLPSQDPIPTPPQAQPATSPPSPAKEQPTKTSESSMSLLNTLMEICATLSQKVVELEQNKQTQALEILKLKKRVKRLEKKKKFRSLGLKRLRKVGKEVKAIDADKDITLVDVDTKIDMDADLQGRIEKDVSDATKEVNVVEPTVFDDEEVIMTMAQTLIKMKGEKARLLDEQMAQRLHDEEIKKAAARDAQEKAYLERAQVVQQQYVDKQENIDWNIVAEQIQEKHLENIRKYQSLKWKPVSIAQARKNMIVYLKNMAGYKMQHFREEPIKKRVAEETLLQESFKKLKAVEVLVAEFKVEALQVMYPIIDWEIHSKGLRSYWKIIRVGGITEAY
nr:hypothetical protein [Tanacetum cinerariifolium]